MARTSEAVFNGHFGEVLRGKHPLWRRGLGVEQTGVFADDPRLRPDILIRAPDAQPVIIETEFAPAASVERDARSRLGRTPAGARDPIEQAIAVRVPDALRGEQERLAERIAAAEFGYCVFSGDPAAPARWPRAGWLAGGIDRIAGCAEDAMVSQRLIVESMSILEDGVRIATRAIADAMALDFTDTEPVIGRVLNQRPGEQTNRMAMAIVASALTFHAAIGGAHGIPPLRDLQTHTRRVFRSALLDCWEDVLQNINYWPIFKVASDIMIKIRTITAERILDALTDAAERLARIGVTARHDLTGRMFQSLIADRKFLATFYTLPTSAALLAEMAAARMDADWSDLEGYPDLSIADLSCGTGTLLSAAYRAVLGRYRRAGGDDSRVHGRMIERAIVAADIMPAAAHLCASQLSSVCPSVIFDNTRVYTMPYGVGAGGERDRGVAIGSLDLTVAAQTRSLFATGQRRTGGAGGDVEVKDVELPHESVDLIVMNPPFTRPTGHEAGKIGVPVPSFAGFGTTEEEQRAMSARLTAIRRQLDEPVGHGNAGLASNFIDLAHAKVRPGGVVALVLPIAAVQGKAWRAVRDLLARRYEDVTVVSIAAAGAFERAFSSDTGIAEALVIATKRRGGNGACGDALFVNLRRRPASLLEAAETAAIASRLPARPVAGVFRAGEQALGSYIRAPLGEGGCAGLREAALADAMTALRGGELRMPRYRGRHCIPVAPLGALGERGLYPLDIGTGRDETPPIRGPFKVVPLSGVPSYPILWGHDAARERRLIVPPDSQGEVRPDCEDRALAAWETAARLHFNRDFRLNSQSLAACLTPEAALGGRAWPNFRLAGARGEEIVALWANSTLGLMSFWWAGSRQQQGRTVLTITTLPALPALDPRGLPPGALERGAGIFAEFRDAPLLPANEAWRDETRQALDRALLVGLLELPEAVLAPLDRLRLQWCAEPSVHGGKSTAPPTGSE